MPRHKPLRSPEAPASTPTLYKIKRVAELLSISEREVGRMTERGDLEVVRISERVVRIPRESVERLIEERRARSA